MVRALRCRAVVRFSLVLMITALPLIGIEAMSTRRETPKRVFDTAAEALEACQGWRLAEGQFSALTPAAQPVSQRARPVTTNLRSCEVDLDQALIIGRRYSVVVDVHYSKPLNALHRPISRTFPYFSAHDKQSGAEREPQHSGGIN